MHDMRLRWAIVVLLPLLTAVYFHWQNPSDATDYLINGIILACEAAFLFKFVLFAVIGHHLRGEVAAKRQASYLFLPILLFVIYIVFYFLAA